MVYRKRAPRDLGSKKFSSRKAKHEGDVMAIAEKNVVTTHRANTIRNVAQIMRKNDFRRIPVVDAGTNRLEGLAVAIDILDFLGGGEKYNIIEKDYKGNFLAAINCPIGKIMADAQFVDSGAQVDEVVDIILKKHTSAIPVVKDGKSREVVAIVTERDILPSATNFGIKVKDAMQKKCITSSAGMMLSDVSKIMVRNRLRRLPVIQEDRLTGIVTVFDVLGFLEKGNFKGVNAEENLSTRVNEIMETEIITMNPEQDLSAVSTLVKKTNLGGFPVVDDGKLLGIVTTTDVIREIYSG